MSIKPGAFPSTVGAPVRELMEKFFHLSNAASTHNDHVKNEEEFANLFTEDGIYEFALKQNKGREEIIAFREFLFQNIPHRDHPAVKFYVGESDTDLMCWGTVGYVFEDQRATHQEWAARYNIVKDKDDHLKFKYVSIIIDPAHPDERLSL